MGDFYDPAGIQAPEPPAGPRGHIWSSRLAAWVKPIRGRTPGRKPSPDHLFCSEPPCWLWGPPLEES